MLKLPDGTLKVLIETKQRVIIDDLKIHDNAFVANIEIIANETIDNSEKIKLLVKKSKENFKQYIKIEDRMPADLSSSILKINTPSKAWQIILFLLYQLKYLKSKKY